VTSQLPPTIITHTGRSVDLPVKRFYAPFEVSAACPDCGRVCVRDLSTNYLGYPVVGEPFDLRLTCFDDEGEETGHEWSVRVRLDMTLTLVEAG